ncbi:melanoregulin [Denticeps clupeoides]|uniref:Melanoregulin n=1 Tax=Denticeps clupeoides TaxID=299321 RepID=A0AAY4CES9_9TELE|nr:melanoregulin-like [Denticeps clupeoides]
MGAFYTCCWRDRAQRAHERRVILRPRVSGGRRVRVDGSWAELNQDPSWSCQHTEPEDDGDLLTFITMRNQADKDTEEWEKLNYDIHSLRCARREVSARWRKILLLLGYQREADSLLAVNRQASLRHPENLDRAGELLRVLWEESGLFPRAADPGQRYLFVMDRLVSLDSAEDFVRLAKEKYPKT